MSQAGSILGPGANDPGAIESIVTNTGTLVTPIANQVQIKGDLTRNIETSGSGNVVTIFVRGTTNHAVQVGNAGGALSSLPLGQDGAVLLGATGGDPNFADLTSVDGSVSFIKGPNSLDLSVSGGGLSWSTVSANTQMVVNHGYAVNSNGATRVMTLPILASVGSTIKIIDIGVSNNAWLVAQNADQAIFAANGLATTTGVTGSLFPTIDSSLSDVNNSAVTLVCVVENILWVVESANCVLDVT